MKKMTLFIVTMLIAYQAQAGLEFKSTYQDWERYEAETATPGERVVIGVTEAKAKHKEQVKTVALRCTYDGVNLLFFKSLARNESSYNARSSIDDGAPFYMDVALKGTTHWATLPNNQLDNARAGAQLRVVLSGDDSKESVVVSLLGFTKMYAAVSSGCQ